MATGVGQAHDSNEQQNQIRLFNSKSDIPRAEFTQKKFGIVLASLDYRRTGFTTEALSQAFAKEAAKLHPNANAVVDIQVDAELTGDAEVHQRVVYRGTAIKTGKWPIFSF